MVLQSIIYILNSVIPKRNKIIFNSFPDLNGNALAVYEYILRERPDIKERYKLVWGVADISTEEAIQMLQYRTGKQKLNVVRKKSIKGIWEFLTSKYVVSTHYYFPSVHSARNQVNVNLWHGMPFKRIGRLLEDVEVSDVQDYADITISTSAEFQKVMAKAFDIDTQKVIISGQPVNDYFFNSDSLFENVVPNISEFNRVIMWLPTYRKSVIGEIREDGNQSGFGAEGLLLHHFDELDLCLKEHKYLLVLKPHPMDTICNIKFPQSENIKVVRNDDLSQKNIQLYEFLASGDVLLTDYSSVFIDFLVTGKPMAFICDDMEAYGSSRGFCFEPPRDYMPGELISNTEQFLNYLNNLDSINEKWKKKYKEIQSVFNYYLDSKASERVCNAIWGEQGQDE